MRHLPRNSSPVVQPFGSSNRLAFGNMLQSGRHVLASVSRVASKGGAGTPLLGREFSAPPREFPASFTNLDGSRGVLRLSGSETIPFLQGLVTNDVNSMQSPNAQPIYAALLNAQGRHLHDMFLFRTGGAKPVILMDVDAEGLEDLKKKLTMYKLRSDVDIANVTEEFSVWARFGQGTLPTEEWTPDPRLQDLGQRTVRGKLDKPPAPDGEPETTPLEYKCWRLVQGVAEGDTEMPSGRAMPLEYNLDRLSGISYSKGCYVGQELIARTNNRGVVRKRLMPVVIAGRTPELGASVCGGDGSTVGDIRQAEGTRGIAHLRLKQGLEAAAGGAKLTTVEGATISPWRPAWWPNTWGNEEALGEGA